MKAYKKRANSNENGKTQSVEKKFLLYSSACLITVFALIVILFSINLLNSLKTQYKDYSTTNCNNLGNEIKQKSNEATELAQRINLQIKGISGTTDDYSEINDLVNKSQHVAILKNGKFTYSYGNLIDQLNMDASYMKSSEPFTGTDTLKDGSIACISTLPVNGNSDNGTIIIIDPYDNTVLDNIKSNDDTEFTIFSKNIRNATTIKKDGKRFVNTPMKDEIYKDYILKDKVYNNYTNINNKKFMTTYIPLKNYNKEIIGAYFSGENIQTKYFQQIRNVIIIGLVSLALIIGSLFLFLTVMKKAVLKPIVKVAEASKKMSNGDLDIALHTKSNDEIKTLYDSFNTMAANNKNIINDIQYMLSEMGNKNFNVSSNFEDSYKGQYSKIITSFAEIKASLGTVFKNINESTTAFNMSSEQISSGAQNLSQGTTEQAASVEQLSANINDIGRMIQNTAKSTKIADNIFTDAMTDISSGQKQMSEMLVAMKDISAKSTEIENIIKTIDDISFQTNILALNASVEAARAGVAGKGFSVVADEVGNLAKKSADAANSTTALIQGTIDAVTKGTSIANTTSATFDAIVNKTSTIQSNLKEITTANISQATAIEEVVTGINQISGVVQTNSATAEESAASCEELASQSNVLQELINSFDYEK